MSLRPMPDYFLVRCSKEEQQKLKEKTGILYNPTGHEYMVYNMEWGEIMGIGSRVAKVMPEAKIGHDLIFHHFVQGMNDKDSRESHLIHWDDLYNYYVVTAYRFNGKRNETYGIWDGKQIIPHPDFVFLKQAEAKKESYKTPDDYINAALKKTKSGILIFDKWKDSRETLEARTQQIKKDNENLAISGTHKPQVRTQMLRNEEQMTKISMEINKVECLPQEVAYANESLSKGFISKTKVSDGTILYIDKRATEKIVTFKGKKYIVAPVEYVCGKIE